MPGGDLVLLHTNDFHGGLTSAKADFIRALDRDLYFDCGDCIKAGNLAIPTREDPAWALLHRAGCDASTLGNRESHVLAAAFEAKMRGLRHPVFCANMLRRRGDAVWPAHHVFERSGMRVGVVGVMVPMVTERMASATASAFLWTPPIEAAIRAADELRSHVDVLVALTHIGLAADRELAERTTAFDLILGGHSHSVLEEPERVGGAWICQTGSHGRYIGRYTFRLGLELGKAELLSLP